MPFNRFKNPDVGVLNYWLARFVLEVQRADREPYPACTAVWSVGSRSTMENSIQQLFKGIDID